jgi:hypothetical protein
MIYYGIATMLVKSFQPSAFLYELMDTFGTYSGTTVLSVWLNEPLPEGGFKARQVTDVIFGQLSNAYESIAVTPEPISTVDTEVQYSNASLCIRVTLLGIVMAVRPEHSLNALYLISFTV